MKVLRQLKEGTKLYVSACTDIDEQKWSMNNDGSITN